MKPWKAILAAVVIFLAGMTSGAMAAHLYRIKGRRPAPPNVPANPPPMRSMGQRIEFMRRLGDKLALTPEQRERIDRHLHKCQQNLRELWEPLEPIATEEMDLLRQRMESELRPDQRERFEALLKERPARGAGESLNWRRHEGSNNPPAHFRKPPSEPPAATDPVPPAPGPQAGPR